MAIIKCPECGHQVSDRARTCPSCGVDIAGNIVRCRECGEVVFADQEVCPNCHHALRGVSREERQAFAAALAAPLSSVPSSADTPPEQPRHRKSWIVLLISFIIALLIVALGLYFYVHTQQQNEMDAYENAMQSTEPAVLQNYLDMYTDAPIAHRDSVEAHLGILKQVDTEWSNAVTSRSRAALEQYIKLHPGNIHITEAQLMIDSLDWIEAANQNTIEAYQKYMKAHVDGFYFDDARMNLDSLRRLQMQEEEAARLKADSLAAISSTQPVTP